MLMKITNVPRWFFCPNFKDKMRFKGRYGLITKPIILL